MAGEIDLLPGGVPRGVVGFGATGVGYRYPTIALLPKAGIRIAGWGDSIIFGGSQKNSSFYDMVMTHSAARFLRAGTGNFGISGETSTQILARLADVVAAQPHATIICAATNDEATDANELTVIRPNMIAIWNAMLDNGILPIDVGLFPATDATDRRNNILHMIWRRIYCRKNGITSYNPWNRGATAAGIFKSGFNLNNDGVHPSAEYAARIADDLIQLIMTGVEPDATAEMLLAFTDTAADQNSPIENAVSFTDTNADGLADNWTALGTGGTYSITPAAGDEFGNWQRCTMSGGTNVGLGSSSKNYATLGWTSGDTIAVAYRVRFGDGGVALTQGYSGVSGQQTVVGRSAKPTGDTWTMYREVVLTGGAGGCAMQFFGTGTGWFEIQRPIMVNLTKMGLA